jgi:hypothetical protein
VALPLLIAGEPERIADGFGSRPCSVIAVQLAELSVSVGCNTGLKSNENNSDSVVYL